MNVNKDPRHARKLAKQQQHLRRVAKKNPDALKGRERAICEWDVHFDNYEDAPKRPSHKEEDEYADFA